MRSVLLRKNQEILVLKKKTFEFVDIL